MAKRHVRYAPVGEYAYLHITALGTAVPVGHAVGTTTTTTITGGQANTVTPASMAGIFPNRTLQIKNGATTEDVLVTAITATTFTAAFANSYSGTTQISSHIGSKLGRVVVNSPGTPPIAAPAAPTLTTATTGGFLVPGTYVVGTTWVTPTGETQLSPLAQIVVPAGTSTNTITVTVAALPGGVTGWNLYIAVGGTLAPLYKQNGALLTTTSTTQTAAISTSGANPPNVNGTGTQFTLLDGNPNAGGTITPRTIAVLTGLAAGQVVDYELAADQGLFYTLAGTTAGDYTLTYLDDDN